MADRFDGEWQVFGPAGLSYASYFQPQANVASATLSTDRTSFTLRYLDGSAIVYRGSALGYDGSTLSGTVSAVELRNPADALLARLSSSAEHSFRVEGGLAVHGGASLFDRLLSGDNLLIGSTQGRVGNLELLQGGSGHDTYRPGNGFTTVADSGGVSRLDLSLVAGPATVALQAQTFTLDGITGTMSGVTEIVGTSGADLITGGADAAFVITTGAGNDTIEAFGATSYGARFTLDAGSGDDTVTIGPSGYGVLQGGAGQDTLRAGGDIRFYGFSGFETLANTYFLRVRTEQLREVGQITNLNPFNSNQVEVELHGPGTVDFQRLMAAGVTVSVRAQAADTHVIGSAGDDRFTVETNALVDGFAMPGTFYGGGGNDTLFGGDGNAILELGGRMADYTITKAPGLGSDYLITDNRPGSPDGADLIIGVNLGQPILRFSDHLASVNEQLAYKADATRLPAQIYNGRLQLFGPDNFDYTSLFPARAWLSSEQLAADGSSYTVTATTGVRVVFSGTGLATRAAYTPGAGSVDRIEVFDTTAPGAPLLLARLFSDPSSGHLMRVPFGPELLHGGPALYHRLMSGNNHIDGSPNDDAIAADIGRNSFFGGAGFHTLQLGRNVDSYRYEVAAGGGYTQVDYVDGYDQMQTFADAMEDPIPGEHPAPVVLNGIVSYWQDVVNSGGQIPPLPLFIVRLIEAFGGGDPHLTTLDGVGYSFHALGEFVLTRSTVPGDDFQIQMRTIPFVGLATVIGQVATRAGGDRVTVDAGRADAVRINGLSADFSNGPLALDGGTLSELQAGQWRLDYATGDRLSISRIDTGTDYLSVTYTPGPGRAAGSLQGVWGNFDGDRLNDFQTADGSVIARPLSADTLYGRFADAWRVSEAGSLLDYGAGESTGTYTRTVTPPAFSLADLPPDVLSRADALVSAAGLTDASLRDFAVYDYLVTGDVRSITQLAALSQAGLSSIDRERPASPAVAPMLGVIAELATQRAAPAGSATSVGFEVYRVGPVVGDVVVQWSVVDAGDGSVAAADFPGGVRPSGQLTIPSLSASARFEVTLPANAVAAAQELLRVQITGPADVPVLGAVAQTAVVSAAPVTGAAADATFLLLDGPGTLSHSGNDWVLELGTLARDAALPDIRLALANATTAGGNALTGTFEASGTLAAFTGLDPVLRLAGGAWTGGISARIDTSVPGLQSSVLTLRAQQGNDSGYTASLPAETLTVRATISAERVGSAGDDVLTGTAGDDQIAGAGGNDTVNGLDGSDRLSGDAGNDRLDGGPGSIDWLIGGAGSDTLDGGERSAPGGGLAIDVAVYLGSSAPLVLDLAAGTATLDGAIDTLLRINAAFGGAGNDQLRGLDGAPTQRGETLRGGAGDDTLEGGSGVDSAEFAGPRSQYTVIRLQDGSWSVRDNVAADGDEGTDRLTGIERIVFADQLLAVGDRAEEVARVAFVLWQPAIVTSTTLFSRGLSFYDVGYDFATLSVAALQFWADDSDAQLAQRLISNSFSSKTVAQLLATMAAHGGGIEGRAAAVREIAVDPATTQRIEDSGIRTTGLVADHVVPDFGTLFGLLPGP